MEMSVSSSNCGDCHSNFEEETEKDNTEVEEQTATDWLVGLEEGINVEVGRAFVDAEDNLKFFPPLYRQRYEVVRQILREERWVPAPATIVEFGCAELAMFTYFKQITHVTKVLMVDIDLNLIDYYGCRAAPLTCDYLDPRENPLHVEVLCGSVADCDGRLLGANAVVCIELIEHLHLDVVEELEKTIFGFIEPEIAIFTTPNSDFNVLLNGMQSKFRHPDHKFEWSREEFSDWTNKVLAQYPHYRVEISGVGAPPKGNEEVGFCSQLALFIRDCEYSPVPSKDAGEVYATCRIYDHPVKCPDKRSTEDKIRDEVLFRLNRMGHFECFLGEEDYSQIPLQDIVSDVQRVVPTADMESVKCHLPPEDIVEKDGNLYVNFHFHSGKYDSESDQESLNSAEEVNNVEDPNYYPEMDDNFQEEGMWSPGPPERFSGPQVLAEYHMAMATLDNVTNLVTERHRFRAGTPDSENDNEEEDEEESNFSPYYIEDRLWDCEKNWNSSAPPLSSENCGQKNDVTEVPSTSQQMNDTERASITANWAASPQYEFVPDEACDAPSPIFKIADQEAQILKPKREPITDSGVDLSPLLNVNNSQDEIGDIFPTNCRSRVGVPLKNKEIPKSTSVEVLHLDGSCTSKRRSGLEYVEFAPSTSVALCYTGQPYCDFDKVSTSANMSMSSERKSLDGSLVRDVADSYSLDFAGDSGYPNSSSLHHDIDVDLTPEQVDDISSENDERSNHSFSEDEFSDSLDPHRSPALLRRVIHPRRPVVPIVFENVENGDLANNNRDGEGNNAIAPVDEREFVALVQEGEMQPLLAAPVADDIILPKNADPFPLWLMDLLNIEDAEGLPAAKKGDEIDQDEGLGEDSI